MQCRRVREQLERDLVLEQSVLPTTDRERLESHLKRCATCRRELSRLRRLHELLTAAPVPPMPDGFAGRVVARAKALPSGPAPRRPALARLVKSTAWRRVRSTARTAAAVAVGLALGAFLAGDVLQNGVAPGWGVAPGPASEGRQDESLAGSGLGRIAIDYDDSLAQAYLELTSGYDG